MREAEILDFECVLKGARIAAHVDPHSTEIFVHAAHYAEGGPVVLESAVGRDDSAVGGNDSPRGNR